MKFKLPTYTLTKEEFYELAEKGVGKILKDLKTKEHEWEQDYFTASDLEGYIRTYIDYKLNPKQSKNPNERFSWWGSRGWRSTKILLPDMQGPLLSLCQSFLIRNEHRLGLHGHNFGRGHISGRRYRSKEVEVPQREIESAERRKQPKVVHFKDEATTTLCCVRPVKSTMYRYRYNARGPKVTEVTSEVTCKRCLSSLSKKEEPAETNK